MLAAEADGRGGRARRRPGVGGERAAGGGVDARGRGAALRGGQRGRSAAAGLLGAGPARRAAGAGRGARARTQPAWGWRSHPGLCALSKRGRGRSRQAGQSVYRLRGQCTGVYLLGAVCGPLYYSQRPCYALQGEYVRAAVEGTLSHEGSSRAFSSLSWCAVLHKLCVLMSAKSMRSGMLAALRRAGNRRRGERAGAGRGVLALLHRQVSRACECLCVQGWHDCKREEAQLVSVVEVRTAHRALCTAPCTAHAVMHRGLQLQCHGLCKPDRVHAQMNMHQCLDQCARATPLIQPWNPSQLPQHLGPTACRAAAHDVSPHRPPRRARRTAPPRAAPAHKRRTCPQQRTPARACAARPPVPDQRHHLATEHAAGASRRCHAQA